MTKCRDPSQSALEADLLLIIILIDHAPSYFIKDPMLILVFFCDRIINYAVSNCLLVNDSIKLMVFLLRILRAQTIVLFKSVTCSKQVMFSFR